VGEQRPCLLPVMLALHLHGAIWVGWVLLGHPPHRKGKREVKAKGNGTTGVLAGARHHVSTALYASAAYEHDKVPSV
jgi:hypothetical protein